jgi:hypothetical protein
MLVQKPLQSTSQVFQPTLPYLGMLLVHRA